jgi:hypothetical protein
VTSPAGYATMSRRDGGAEEIDAYDDEIPLWEDNVDVVARAVPIVLLCSFVEWGLKRAAVDICGSVPSKTNGSMSKIDSLLHHLRNEGKLNLTIDECAMQHIKSFRNLRNQFAHGDWGSLRTELNDTSLRPWFHAVSQLFEDIEKSAWESARGPADT